MSNLERAKRLQTLLHLIDRTIATHLDAANHPRVTVLDARFLPIEDALIEVEQTLTDEEQDAYGRFVFGDEAWDTRPAGA